MIVNKWDVIVIGGGMVGLATTYHLSRLGVKVLLLQKDEIGGGTSAANAGRAQVNEGNLDLTNIRIIREGLERLGNLEEELGMSFDWHRLGYLCLIKTDHLRNEWLKRAEILSSAGIPTEVIDIKNLKAAEPHLNTQGLIGAAYSLEGLLNPFLFCWAYARAAIRNGAEIRIQCPVTSLKVEGNRVKSVEAGGVWYSSDNVVVTCGAWTPQVIRMAGVEIPIRHTHAEAYITEKLPPVLHNTIGLADFYEIIHGKEKAVAVGVGPHSNGTLLVTEAVCMTDEYHRRNSSWGLSGISEDLIRLYPVLSGVKVTRAWGSPTPFTPDDETVIGWLPELENVFVAASFKQTITGVPLVSEWIARLLVGESIDVNLDQFSPSRFQQGSQLV